MGDKMQVIELLRDGIMLHTHIQDKEKATDLARTWAAA